MTVSTEKLNKKASIYDYAYSTGRIRALENSLMNSGQILRLFDAATEEEIEKVLSDNGYKIGGNLLDSIKNDLIDSFLLVRSIVPDTSIVDIMMLENDYHNIKVILKSIIPHTGENSNDNNLFDEAEEDDLAKDDDFSGILEEANRDITIDSLKSYLAFPGVYNPEDLISLVFEENPDFADGEIISLVKSALREYKKSQDTGAVDKIADRMYFDRLISYSEELGDTIFKEYCGFLADSNNLEILFRSRKMKFDINVFESYLVKGYKVSNKDLLELYNAGDAEIKRAYRETKCEKLVELSDNYSKGNAAVIFAKTADEIQTEIMRKSKMVLFGPSIPLAYLYAKQLQAKNINIALTCKRNNLPKEISYELMRNPF